jgi:hypothetical protein
MPDSSRPSKQRRAHGHLGSFLARRQVRRPVGSLGPFASLRSRDDDRVLVTADHDFVQMLFASGDTSPSLVLVRDIEGLRSAELARLLLEALSAWDGRSADPKRDSRLDAGPSTDQAVATAPRRRFLEAGSRPSHRRMDGYASTHPTSRAERRPSLALGAPSLYGRLSAQLRSGSSERLIHPAGDGSEMGAVMPWKAPAEAARGCGHFALTQR